VSRWTSRSPRKGRNSAPIKGARVGGVEDVLSQVSFAEDAVSVETCRNEPATLPGLQAPVVRQVVQHEDCVGSDRVQSPPDSTAFLRRQHKGAAFLFGVSWRDGSSAP